MVGTSRLMYICLWLNGGVASLLLYGEAVRDYPPADDQLHQVGRGKKRALQKMTAGVNTCLLFQEG